MGRAFYLLNEWTAKKDTCPLELLDAAILIEKSIGSKSTEKETGVGEDKKTAPGIKVSRNKDNWLKNSLLPLAWKLRQQISDSAQVSLSAQKFSGDVEGWLHVTGFTGAVSQEAMELRKTAFDTLLKDKELKHCKRILKKITPPDIFRTGQLREAQGEFSEAARIFSDLNEKQDALRNWRLAGNWEESVKLAETNEKKDLQWLNSFDEILRTRPERHESRLTEAEKKRLRLALEKNNL